MLNDPIVEEVHRIREKMLQDCGGDLHKLADRMRTIGAKFPNHVRSPEELRKIAEARQANETVSK